MDRRRGVFAVGLLDKIHSIVVGRSAGAPADGKLMMDASQMVVAVVAVVQGRKLDFGGEPRCLRSVEVGVGRPTIRMAIRMATGMIPGKRETISTQAK